MRHYPNLHKRLGPPPGPGLPRDEDVGGVSLAGDYEANRDECISAARSALRSLDLVLTGGQMREEAVRIEARTDAFEPIAIRIALSKDHPKASVTFLAGTDDDKDSIPRALARRLKEEFERSLRNRRRAGI